MAEVTTSRPAGKVEFEKAATAAPAAVQAFWEVLSDSGWAGLDDPQDGARAAELLISTSKSAWWEDGAGPLLSSRQAAEFLCVSPDQVIGLVAEGRLFAVHGPGRQVRYPLSQFDMETGQPWRILPTVLELLRSVEISDESLASWLHEPHPKNELGGLSCEQWLRQGRPAQTIVEIAKRTVHDLSH